MHPEVSWLHDRILMVEARVVHAMLEELWREIS
jgi:hypothetical protein